jgi:hypothetical protein
MDNLQKAQKMAKIHLIQKKLKEQNDSLEQMAMELLLAGRHNADSADPRNTGKSKSGRDKSIRTNSSKSHLNSK